MVLPTPARSSNGCEVFPPGRGLFFAMEKDNIKRAGSAPGSFRPDAGTFCPDRDRPLTKG